MLEIYNAIPQCLIDKHTMRDRGQWIDAEVLHRFHVPGIDDAAGVAAFDQTQTNLGSRMAYTWVVGPERTEQALPLDIIGWHCRGASRSMAGVAVLHDCRRSRPPEEMIDRLVELLAELAIRRGSVRIYGHDQMPGGSQDPDKICPGPYLDIMEIDGLVRERMKARANQRLLQAGMRTTAAACRNGA